MEYLAIAAFCRLLRHLKIEISLSVEIANVFHHLANGGQVIRKQALFNEVLKKVDPSAAPVEAPEGTDAVPSCPPASRQVA